MKRENLPKLTKLGYGWHRGGGVFLTGKKQQKSNNKRIVYIRVLEWYRTRRL